MAADRRKFLKQSLAAGAAALVGKALTAPRPALAAEKPGSQIKLGMVTYQWGKDWDLPTIFKNLEAAKVLGVELRTGHKHGVEPNLNADRRKEVKKQFADSPVKLVGLGSAECFDSPDPAKLAKSIEATKAYLQLSADIGSSGVKVRPNNFHKEVEKARTIEQIGTSLNVVGKFAGGLSQQVRLEVHGQCCELPTIKQIMDFVTDPNVAVCWNSNDADLKGDGLEANFNLVKSRLGATGHLRPLDTPRYPWDKLIELFVKLDYKGWLLLECANEVQDPVKALVQQREIFERLLAKAQA